MDPSLAALASAAAKSTATLAKAKKALVPCKVCHGSSWVHGNNPAPFPPSTTPTTTTAASTGTANLSTVSINITSAANSSLFSFSPKPHCSDCTKCTACTNGKQIGPSSGGLHSTTSLSPVSEQVASSTSIATTSSNTSTSTGTSTSGLVKKRGVSPDSTSKSNSSSFILEMGDVAHLSSAPDTAAAVAAVSISRIKTTSAGRGVQAMATAIKVVNGDDDDEDSSETEASQDENDIHAKRAANIKRRVQNMGSLDNLSSNSLSKKASQSFENINTATATGLRRPLSSSSLAKQQQQQQSTNSSKETVAVNTAGNSISSLPTSQNPQIYIKESTSSATPRIIASSVSGSHVSLVSDFYGGGIELHQNVQHPAVNILSMGSGMLARKKDVVAAIVTGAGSSSSHGGGGAADGKDSGAVASSSKSLPIPSSVPTGARLQNSMVMNDSSGLIGEGCFDREEFPDLVDLGIIFGTKANPEAAKTRMIWSARIYEAARKEFLSKPYDDPVFPDRPPNDEIKYRILENFEEGRLETVTYSTRPTGSEFISAGDIESLVDALIFPLDQDNSYTEVFLASYRFFMPASELLTSLIEWYNVEVDPSTATQQQEAYFKQKRRQFRGRAAKVLLTWIKNHWHDFHVDKDLLDELSEFVGDLGEVCFGDNQRMTQAIREQRLSWYMTQYIPPFSGKRAPPAESAKPWGLLWEPEAFAAQLTLIDHHYFRQIRPDTYLTLLQHRVSKDKIASDDAVKVLMDYVSWFRLVSSYTASLVYKEDTVKKRTKAIKRFIKVAKECRELNNFNTLFAIVHGLKRSLVAKMGAAWDGLAGKHVDTFRELEALTDPRGGYAKFWGELKMCVAPLIPFFAAYIHDLLEIHETEPVFTRDLNKPKDPVQPGYRIVSTDDDDANDTINFSKFYNLYSIVAEIEVWRSYSYNSVIPEAAAAANDPKGDTCAVVLNHMRDWKLVEDSVLDL